MKILIKLNLILTTLLLLTTGMLAQEIKIVPGQLLVKMKANAKSKKTGLSNQLRAARLKSYPELGIELWKSDNITTIQATLELIEEYKNHPEIEFIEPNYLWQAIESAKPNDPFFQKLWGLNNTGQNGGTVDADIDAPEAYCLEVDYQNVVVGIVDTGIDYTHEDLAENIWQNLGEDADGDGSVLEKDSLGNWIFDSGDENGIDDDGNGYADDFVGWDFVYNDNDPMDLQSHGTHCAGTIGAVTNNEIGINGVAPNAKLAALKFLNDNGTGSTVGAIEALNYAVSMGIPITNNSWGGGGFSAVLYEAIENAKANNHLFIAAAGNYNLDNDQYNFYPAAYGNENIISVAASDKNDIRSDFSSYGAITVDLAAPGSQIYSCLPGNGYTYKSGTSMATPHIAGVCAALLGAFPNSDFSLIKNTLINSVDSLPSFEGKCTSEGRVNLHSALIEMGAPQNTCNDEDPPVQPDPNLPCDPMVDSLALIAFYNATDGPNWTNTWDLTQPKSSWRGITLNDEGCVLYFQLTWNSMDGSIPAEIGNLKHLEKLVLTSNGLTDTIPNEIAELTRLQILNLNGNKLTGNIPTQLKKLKNLTELDLASNNLNGNIPVEISELYNLKILYLFRNYLTGEIPGELEYLTNLERLCLDHNALSGNIPGELGNLNNLETLGLSTNQLKGKIPIQLSNLGKIEYLILHENLLTGNIPPELGNLSTLIDLSLNDNQLTGSIPSELNGLRKLAYLEISNNHLTGCYPAGLESLPMCTFSGNDRVSDGNNFETTWENFCSTTDGTCQLEPWQCDPKSDSLALIALYNSTDGPNWTNKWDLTKPMSTWYDVFLHPIGCVKHLSMDGNNLTGNLPPEIGNLKYLQSIGLNWNKLNGEIPVEIGELENLRSLRLNNNQLTGNIPVQIGYLKNLTQLYLGVNQLTGTIPAELAELNKLERLSLYNNQLSGEIPIELEKLTSLESLGLDGNQLSGYIPKELGNLITLESLVLSNNQLTGDIPVQLANCKKLRSMHLSNNFLTGKIPSQLGELTNMINLFVNDNQLTGSIPSEFGNLINMGVFKLYNNDLSGCYPDIFLTDSLPGCLYSKNRDISDGNNFDANWEDFCATGKGRCITQVWPGDFDNNGAVEISDMLYWGVAYNNTGKVRPNSTSHWVGQDCEDWVEEVNGINNKHQDANGDGKIDDGDMPVFIENMAEVHSTISQNKISSTMRFNLLPNLEASYVSNSGKTYVYDFYIEDDDTNTVSAHGVSASIFFGNLNVAQASINIQDGSPLDTAEHYHKFDNENNTLNFAATRTDRIGKPIIDTPILRIVVQIIEAETDMTFALSIKPGSVMQADGSLFAVQGATIYEMLNKGDINTDSIKLNASVIHTNCDTGGSISINAYGGSGNYFYKWNTGETTADITNLSPGIYSVLVCDDAGMSSYIKVEVQGQFILEYDENGGILPCDKYTTCPTVIDFENSPPGEGVYQANKTIYLNADISKTPNVVLKAGGIVTLGPGLFTGQSGLEIIISEEGCK